jgi:tRNA pseudouridine(38-40) synthase
LQVDGLKKTLLSLREITLTVQMDCLQVAHFVTFHCFEDLEILHASLNGILPHDVRIREVSAVHPDFHARFSAQRKTYKYKAYVAPVMEPFQRSYAYHIRHQLNINAMQAAALYFVGKHDFSAFANASNDLSLRPPVREIVRFNVVATVRAFVTAEVFCRAIVCKSLELPLYLTYCSPP